MAFADYVESLVGFGLTKDDAEVVADCMVTKRMCSWINNEPISEDQVKKVNEFITQQGLPIVVVVESVATRNKFIWEVKLKK
jgi:hypothetical protein